MVILTNNEILYITNQWSKIPKDKICLLAAEFGFLDLLEWGIKFINPQTYGIAAQNGQIAILKFLRLLNPDFCDNGWASSGAAAYGDIQLLEWLYGEKFEFNVITCANFKNLQVLKWCRKHNVEWDSQTFAQAARIPDVEMLQYLKEEKCY